MMNKMITICLVGVFTLSLASCSCSRCKGRGTEIAMTSGVHPYTGSAYNANEMISCLKCGGSGEAGATPAAAGYSVTGAGAAALYAPPAPTKTKPIHVHRHYSNNYVVW